MLGAGILERKKTRAIRQIIVRSSRARIAALVQELQIARIDSHRLVRVGANQITVRDIISPSGATVGLARERAGLGRRQRGPSAAQAGGGEGAKVPTVGALGLDDHQVLVLTRQSVDLHGLEQVHGAVAHDHRRGCAEAAGEIANGHAGAVDLAVVAGEEQVHVLTVANDGLVDGARAGARDRAGEEWLGGRPAIWIRGVARRPVRKSRRPPLMSQDPSALWGKVEERRRDRRGRHACLRGRAHLRPVGEGTETHGSIS